MSGTLSPDTTSALLQASQSQTSTAASHAKNVKTIEQIEETAREFEAVFVTAMLRPMFEGVDISDSDFGGGKGEEIFTDMMMDEYGKSISQAGGIGLADDIKAELIRLQGLDSQVQTSPSQPLMNTISATAATSISDLNNEPTAAELNAMIIGE